jgi:ribosomal protein S4
MIAFIQKSNRNAFTLRYRKYKNLRYDWGGRIALANKRNKITNYLKYFAFKDTMRRIKFLPKLKQNQIKRTFKLLKYRKPKLFTSDNSKYKIGKKTGRQKDPFLKRRSAIKNLKHTFRFFYGLSFRKKSFRKFMSMKKRQPITALELRIDTILYRCNFFQSISESRRFLSCIRILKKKFINKKINFVCQRIRLKPNSQISTFQMILMTPNLAIKRRSILLNNILSGNKLHNCRYSHFLINFKLLAIIMIRYPLAAKIKYPFCNVPLTKFLGVAKYL